MTDTMKALLDSLAEDAQNFRAAAGTDLAYGLMAAKILQVRAAECERVSSIVRQLHGEASPPVKKVKGPGPYPGPCEACGGISNSYSRFCSKCDEIDKEDYILTADDLVRKRYPNNEEKNQKSRERRARRKAA